MYGPQVRRRALTLHDEGLPVLRFARELGAGRACCRSTGRDASRPNSISVARREALARLEAHVGPTR